MTQPVQGQGPRWPILLGGGALLLLLALAIYWPCLGGGILWNDPDYLTSPALASLHGLWRIWFEVGATQQYYPLLHSAFWFEHRLWGDAMVGYHVANVVLHAAVAGLFYLVLRRLAVPGAGLAALLFVVHPVLVESVAWITEEKNTLSAVFFLLATLAYLEFDERRWKATGYYFLSLVLFLCAVLSKTVTAPLPAVLLVLAWWRRGRLSWKRDAVPLLPWFALGAAGGLFSAWVERTYIGAHGAPFALGPAQRFLVAGRAIWFYLRQLAWPANLNFIYPRWQVNAGSWRQWLFPLAALALLAAFWQLRRRSRAPLAAALLFGGLLFPVLGFFNVYAFVYSFVADHFAYLAAMPVIAFAAAGWGLWARAGSGRAARLAAAAVVAILAVLSWRQSHMYTDEVTFYRTILERNPNCWMAYNNLGDILWAEGRPEAAAAEYQKALYLNPNAQAHYNLGVAYAGERDFSRAIGEFDQTLRLNPEFTAAHYNRGVARLATGNLAGAIADYRAALRLDPNLAEARTSLGFALVYSGDLPSAISECEAALRLDPGSREVRFNLGFALAAVRRFDEAVPQYEEAIRIDPGFPEAHNFLGVALAAEGRPDAAAAEFEAALRLRPEYAEAQKNLAALRRR